MSQPSFIAFDIETGPLDEKTVLNRVNPFEPSEPPGAFDPDSVKLGNLRDQAKIDAKITDAKAKHEKSVANYDAETEQNREAWRIESMDRASLNAGTGQVLAVGYKSSNGSYINTVDNCSEG